MLSLVTRLQHRTLLSIAFLITFTLTSAAQQKSPFAAFDASHPVTLQGTIQTVVTHPAPGTLLGEHLMIATTTGMHDVHIGPYLAKTAVGKTLHTNDNVTVVGSPMNLNGKPIFLASQLVVNGQTIPVRNRNGFLIHPPAAKSQRQAPKTSAAGGAQ